MKDRKISGYILFIGGIAVLGLSLLADTIGIGGSGAFGFKQILGAVTGAIAAVAGLVLAVKR